MHTRVFSPLHTKKNPALLRPTQQCECPLRLFKLRNSVTSQSHWGFRGQGRGPRRSAAIQHPSWHPTSIMASCIGMAWHQAGKHCFSQWLHPALTLRALALPAHARCAILRQGRLQGAMLATTATPFTDEVMSHVGPPRSWRCQVLVRGPCAVTS